MNTKSILVIVAVLAVVVIVVVFISRSGKNPYQYQPQPTVNQSQSTVRPVQPESPTPSELTIQKTEGVTLTSAGFAPQNLTVKVNTKVVWTNKSGATAAVNSAVHPTHSVYPPLNLGSFGNGETLSLVFDKAGTYKYHNHLNASQTGTVKVEE